MRKHYLPTTCTLTICRASEIRRVFTPGLVTQILRKMWGLKMLNFTLVVFHWFAQQSSYPVWSWAMLGYAGLHTQPSQSRNGGKGRLNSNRDQSPIKLIMTSTLFLLAKFTKMLGLLLRLMSGNSKEAQVKTISCQQVVNCDFEILRELQINTPHSLL